MPRLRSFSLEHYVYLQAVGFALFVWASITHSYHDDAYISLRYAQNLLDGFGLTWNPGERIEGYTNFLHIVLTAALGYLGMDLKLASRVLGFLGYFGTVALIIHYAHALPLHRRESSEAERLTAAIPIAVVASSLPMLAWCMAGLEANVFAFFLTAGICLALRMLTQPVSSAIAALAGVLFALATLTRPEGVLLFGFTGAFLVLIKITRPIQTVFSWKHLFLMAGAYALLFVPYMAWRIDYFGNLMPNTYYAKTYGIDMALKLEAGLFYLLQFVIFPPVLPIFGLALLVITGRHRRLNAPIAYLALLITFFCAYVVVVGGDFMSHLRFLVPVVPAIALLMYHCNAELTALGKGRLIRDITVGLLVFLILQAGMLLDNRPSRGALSGLAVAEYINTHWKKNALIAINPAGALPYTASQFRYIDMFGLLDRQIARRVITTRRAEGQSAMAHLKGDGDYVLSRKPDYIIWGVNWGQDTPLYLSDLEMSENPEFRRDYRKIERYITPPAELLAYLQATPPDPKRGPVLNDKNQLRFIYFERK